ncbi:uncharacterized protein BJ171DRAFT_127792 [Polychytrium aggregatum]|uniref:uncharacterized protein n=1 Tax=Polychytrium aggregatum TaxID=110093 RepID=UPI0022FF04EE|nr:uncharacterized protein BJ171DRAFT_127792 [Polychytrium aggregatum]KAI9204043.1 hypothetical protein BJ171DRAFT_127792 [Polychytrium aggregatum]
MLSMTHNQFDESGSARRRSTRLRSINELSAKVKDAEQPRRASPSSPSAYPAVAGMGVTSSNIGDAIRAYSQAANSPAALLSGPKTRSRRTKAVAEDRPLHKTHQIDPTTGQRRANGDLHPGVQPDQAPRAAEFDPSPWGYASKRQDPNSSERPRYQMVEDAHENPFIATHEETRRVLGSAYSLPKSSPSNFVSDIIEQEDEYYDEAEETYEADDVGDYVEEEADEGFINLDHPFWSNPIVATVRPAILVVLSCVVLIWRYASLPAWAVFEFGVVRPSIILGSLARLAQHQTRAVLRKILTSQNWIVGLLAFFVAFAFLVVKPPTTWDSGLERNILQPALYRLSQSFHVTDVLFRSEPSTSGDADAVEPAIDQRVVSATEAHPESDEESQAPGIQEPDPAVSPTPSPSSIDVPETVAAVDRSEFVPDTSASKDSAELPTHDSPRDGAAAMASDTVIQVLPAAYQGIVTRVSELEVKLKDHQSATAGSSERIQALSQTLEKLRQDIVDAVNADRDHLSWITKLQERLDALPADLENRLKAVEKQLESQIAQALTDVVSDMRNLKAIVSHIESESREKKHGTITGSLQELVKAAAENEEPHLVSKAVELLLQDPRLEEHVKQQILSASAPAHDAAKAFGGYPDDLDTLLDELRQARDRPASSGIQRDELMQLVQEVVAQHMDRYERSSPPGREPLVANLGALDHDLEALVVQTVEKLSADRLGQPDYALSSGGGRVMALLTSPTFDLGIAPAFVQNALAKLFHRDPIERHPPSMALNPDVNVGNCWPMSGDKGTLGIRLAKPIVPKSFTIEHANPANLPEAAKSLRSAPRQIEAWAVFDPELFAVRIIPQMWSSSAPADDLLDQEPEIAEAGILLAEAVFVPETQHVHTFAVSPQAQQALRKRKLAHGSEESLVSKVVLRVRGNWGADGFTCIYRFRVHADE